MGENLANLGEDNGNIGLTQSNQQFSIPHGHKSVYCGVQGVRIREKTLALALDGVGGLLFLFHFFQGITFCAAILFSLETSEAGVLFTEDKVNFDSRPRLCGLPGLSPLWILALPHEQMGISRQATTE